MDLGKDPPAVSDLSSFAEKDTERANTAQFSETSVTAPDGSDLTSLSLSSSVWRWRFTVCALQQIYWPQQCSWAVESISLDLVIYLAVVFA